MLSEDFAAFDVRSGLRTSEDLQACFTCHRQFGDAERMFTQPLAQEFIRTGAVQQAVCDQPERTPCP